MEFVGKDHFPNLYETESRIVPFTSRAFPLDAPSASRKVVKPVMRVQYQNHDEAVIAVGFELGNGRGNGHGKSRSGHFVTPRTPTDMIAAYRALMLIDALLDVGADISAGTPGQAVETLSIEGNGEPDDMKIGIVDAISHEVFMKISSSIPPEIEQLIALFKQRKIKFDTAPIQKEIREKRIPYTSFLQQHGFDGIFPREIVAQLNLACSNSITTYVARYGDDEKRFTRELVQAFLIEAHEKGIREVDLLVGHALCLGHMRGTVQRPRTHEVADPRLESLGDREAIYFRVAVFLEQEFRRGFFPVRLWRERAVEKKRKKGFGDNVITAVPGHSLQEYRKLLAEIKT